ncbi:MAG: polyribonucleotide nucleotidyltransferase [Patescibacteria group bacterium]
MKTARTKKEISQAENAAVEAVKAALSEEEKKVITDKMIGHAIHDVRGTYARSQAFEANWREGNRAFDEIRPLVVKTGLLPRTHGSSLFQRGETQILNVATLGGPSDVQWIDTMEVDEKKRYIHYYNFPSFSVGENKPSRGPGRREIGHGALAERALIPVLPSQEEWPYTMLLTSEVLESNGSSSMASACASSLSLMDAGVPIKKPVAGIAMGLFVNEKGEHRILTDIAGVEDEQGDMDFKVAGTADGITALQMDIKLNGVKLDVLREGFAQAKKARLEILDAMNAVLPEPRKEMSPYAPRIETIRIPVEKIGDVIGPKGKHINAIIEETGVEIDIADDGLVSITSNDAEAMKKAVAWVKNMTREIQVGERFDGKVTRLMDFGAFVELIPGTGVEGMVHISQFREERVENIHDVVKVGDVIPVVVTEIDSMGRINLSHIAAVNPNYKPVERDRGPRHGGGGRPHHGGGRPGPFRGPRPPR